MFGPLLSLLFPLDVAFGLTRKSKRKTVVNKKSTNLITGAKEKLCSCV